MAHHGVPYDAIQGWVTETSQVGVWAVQYGMGKTCRFSVKVFGDHAANVLANEWCNKCQFFFNLYQQQGCKQYVYIASDIAAYTPLDSFTRLKASLLISSSTMTRLLALDNLLPK